MTNLKKTQSGFTLIEILVVIGLIAILAAIVIIAINPARQFAQGRDTQRTSNVETILNAIGQRMADNKGVFNGVGVDGNTCPALPQSVAAVPSPLNAGNVTGITVQQIGTGGLDLSCLVPTYVSALPLDPAGGTTAAATGYYITQDSSATGGARITVFSEATENALKRTDFITLTR